MVEFILYTKTGRFLALTLIPVVLELIVAIWYPQLLIPMICGSVVTATLLVLTDKDLKRWY